MLNVRPSPTPAAQPIELSIVLPCLNEAETLAACIDAAHDFFADNAVSGEVIVADNGSTDGSLDIAGAHGARVVPVARRGYGAALIGGIAAARGRFVAMGDADSSYDFRALAPFLLRLRSGADLVMGNRFAGGIAAGAMPVLHRWLGNPVLSFLGRAFFRVPVADFHCGLRAFRRDAVLGLGLAAPGMEFASEMVVKAALNGLVIAEVPTTLAVDGRSRAPHLRTWRDGWRHLRFLLTYAPRHLFVYPGLALGGVGLLGVATLAAGSVHVGRVELGVTTLLLAAMAVLLGSQLVGFGVLARLHGIATGMWPPSSSAMRLRRHFTVERGCLGGALLTLGGLVAVAAAFASWADAGFGSMETVPLMRRTIPAVLAVLLGLQTVFTSFMVGLVAGDEPRA